MKLKITKLSLGSVSARTQSYLLLFCVIEAVNNASHLFPSYGLA